MPDHLSITTPLALVAAVARNGVIGNRGELPWQIQGELAYFRQITMGDAVIMGRKTWESLPNKPLAGRYNVIVSHQKDYMAEGAICCPSLNKALIFADEWSRTSQRQKISIIGGASLFSEALTFCRWLYLTEIDRDYDGDIYFPLWPRQQFNCLYRKEGLSRLPNPPHQFCLYERKDS